MNKENKQNEIMMTETTAGIPPECSSGEPVTTVSPQECSNPESTTKKRKFFSETKNLFKTQSKRAIIEFFFKKIIAYGLTIALSFFTAVKTVEKRTFQDDFKDYYHEILVPLQKEMDEVIGFWNYVSGTGFRDDAFDDIMENYEDNNISDKLKSAQSICLSYASSNKDIAEVNNLYIDVIGEFMNFTSLLYSYSCIYEMSDGNMESDFGRYFMCETLSILERLKTKMELLEDVKSEKFEKYGITTEEIEQLIAG